MPLISIVMPTYRRPEFLREALRSVVAQTLGDFEVLVCDNAAQPESEAVVRAFADERLVYVPRERNLGMVANVYDGFRRARGELVMKLDDDDELHPDCLAVLSAPFRDDPELAVSASDFDIMDAQGADWPAGYEARARMMGRDRAPEGRLRPFSAAVARGTFEMVSALIRRSAIDWTAIEEQAATAYDVHLLLLAAQDAAAAHYSRRRLVRYRVHESSDTVQNSVPQAQGALFVREHALRSGRHTDVEALESTYRGTAVHLARALVREGRTSEARATLLRTRAVVPDVASLRLLALTALPGRLAAYSAQRRVQALALPGHRTTGRRP